MNKLSFQSKTLKKKNKKGEKENKTSNISKMQCKYIIKHKDLLFENLIK